MSCCNQNAQLDNIYLSLHKRLLEFGNEIYGEQLMASHPSTFMWIFTFYSDAELCEECQFSFSAMNKWFHDYGLFNNPIRNVKWIIEDEPEKNFIYKELGFSKTPMHLFCDKDGKIIDIIMGFPTPEWLEKHILPLIQADMNIL